MMNVPCLMGLRCPHCIYDECGDPVCCHPYTRENITDEEWWNANGLCDELDECPLIKDGSELEYLLRFSDEYNAEEWASVMSMLRVAVHRGSRAHCKLDDMREEAASYVFRLSWEMLEEQSRQRRRDMQ